MTPRGTAPNIFARRGRAAASSPVVAGAGPIHARRATDDEVLDALRDTPAVTEVLQARLTAHDLRRRELLDDLARIEPELADARPALVAELAAAEASYKEHIASLEAAEARAGRARVAIRVASQAGDRRRIAIEAQLAELADPAIASFVESVRRREAQVMAVKPDATVLAAMRTAREAAATLHLEVATAAEVERRIGELESSITFASMAVL